MMVNGVPLVAHGMEVCMSEQELKSPIACAIWRSPLLHIVRGGVEVKCKSCRGDIHFYSKERFLQEWEELERLAGISQMSQIDRKVAS